NGVKISNVPKVVLDYRTSNQMLQRRAGLRKALSEVKIRYRFMREIGECSLKNRVLILSRILFHLMPERLLKLAYTRLR
ncbi:glycosyl transferase, partial [Marinobacter sp. Z-F4-2]